MSEHEPSDVICEAVADSDGYRGPAELIDGDRVLAVQIELAGHFDPISGKYSWYGRVAASPEVTAILETPGDEPDDVKNLQTVRAILGGTARGA